MRADLREITAAEGVAVTVHDLCDHLRVTDDGDADLIASYIAAATQYVEQFTGRTILRSRWVEVYDCFPRYAAPLRLEIYPVAEVVEVRYRDEDGDLLTLDPSKYRVRLGSMPVRLILPVSERDWPLNATEVEVEVWAGKDTVDPSIEQAIRLLVGSWYEHREEVVVGATPTRVPMAAEALLRSMSVRGVG